MQCTLLFVTYNAPNRLPAHPYHDKHSALDVLKAVENVGGATDHSQRDSTIILLKKCALHVKENIETIKKGKKKTLRLIIKAQKGYVPSGLSNLSVTTLLDFINCENLQGMNRE